MNETRPRRVLLVDDDARFRAAVVDLLADVTDLVVVAAVDSPDAALAVASNEPLDVAVVDVQMPGGSGVELTHKLRAAMPKLEIVALSAAGDSASRSAMAEAGARTYLVKGDDSRDLVDVLLHDMRSNDTSGRRYGDDATQVRSDS